MRHSEQNEREYYATTDALLDAEMMLHSANRAADEDAEYSLESILAEYGGARKRSKESAEGDTPEEEAQTEMSDEQDGAPRTEETPEWPREPQGVSLEDLVAQTVASVKAEAQSEAAQPKAPTRTLFSRRSVEETEQFYETFVPPREEPKEEDPPEPDYEEELSAYREQHHTQKKPLIAALGVTVLTWAVVVAEHLGLMGEWWTLDPLLRGAVYTATLAVVSIMGAEVFAYAFRALADGRVVHELGAALCCASSLIDSALLMALPARAAHLPFAPAAMLVMAAAMWGRYLFSGAMCESIRVAAKGEALYQLTATAGGAAKRPGQRRGFFNTLEKEDVARHWQGLLLPIVMIASFVFAVLSTVRNAEGFFGFFWYWSVILCASTTLMLPMTYSLPFHILARRLQKSGSAVAGYCGAEELTRSNCVILTDGDLFPPGTVSLNGIKVFGEEIVKVASYAATLSRAAGTTGLDRIFEGLLQGQDVPQETAVDLNYYEEGGVCATIRGEEVLMGTMAFVRKMGVHLPGGLTLKTGVFLAVDKQLIAIFAVKYIPAGNVDWAVHAMRRNRMTPVLATRDGNITPALLKRKFKTDAQAIYPKMSTRLVLSEQAHGALALALLLREGLMPYAEVMIGSKRLCSAVRRGNRLSLLGSVAGALLGFYLTFAGAFSVLTPIQMVLYLLLWELAAVLTAGAVDRY